MTDRTQSSSLPWATLVRLRSVASLVHEGLHLRPACFLSALQLVAGQMGKTDIARKAVVHSQVHLGKPNGMEGFGLEVEIQVEGIEDQALIDAGHAVSG